MNLGEFREKFDGMSDSTELVFWHDGDTTWYELVYRQQLPAAPIHPESVLIFECGQQVELELDLAARTGIDEWD